jgi:hypothetical protein
VLNFASTVFFFGSTVLNFASTVFFFVSTVLNFAALRSGQFKGSKKSWPPQNVPRNGS